MHEHRGNGAAGLRRAALALGALAAVMVPMSSLAQRSRGEVVRGTMPAVVMVLSADIVNGKVQPVSSGSGTILTPDGSVLTNYHVINNEKQSRLHDLFVIGRFRSADKEPEFVCAGYPNAGKMKPQLDLALVKCQVDMNGRPYNASNWPTIPVGRSEDLVPGEEIIVIGYPDVGGSTIHVTTGKISGWSGERGGAGRAWIKTEADITHGNSGGTAVNEIGEFIGVPSAFRVTTEGDTQTTVGQVGLVRPVEHARDLIAIAAGGWTPREGDNAVTGGGTGGGGSIGGSVGGSPVGSTPAPPPGGGGGATDDYRKLKGGDPGKAPSGSGTVTVSSKVVDAHNGAAIRGAFVVVLKAGIKARDLDADRLDEQALTFGQTNNYGQFTLNHPVPRGASYTVAVVADGYQPLIEDDVLVVDGSTPSSFDPWGSIRLDRK